MSRAGVMVKPRVGRPSQVGSRTCAASRRTEQRKSVETGEPELHTGADWPAGAGCGMLQGVTSTVSNASETAIGQIESEPSRS